MVIRKLLTVPAVSLAVETLYLAMGCVQDVKLKIHISINLRPGALASIKELVHRKGM